jgi:7-cyano-7-deazaguanine synthase
MKIDLPFINDLFKSDLLQSGGEIPENNYSKETLKRTVVPFRNGIMLSIAAGVANSNNIRRVYYAAHGGDHIIYPDCRPGFINNMKMAITMGTDPPVKLYAPYMSYLKRDIIMDGCLFNVPLELTWSCYKGEMYHCGECSTCRERKQAFKEAQVTDKTKYKDN